MNRQFFFNFLFIYWLYNTINATFCLSWRTQCFFNIFFWTWLHNFFYNQLWRIIYFANMAFMTNHLKNKGGPFKTYCLIYFHILGIHRNQPYGNINCALLEFGEKLGLFWSNYFKKYASHQFFIYIHSVFRIRDVYLYTYEYIYICMKYIYNCMKHKFRRRH